MNVSALLHASKIHEKRTLVLFQIVNICMWKERKNCQGNYHPRGPYRKSTYFKYKNYVRVNIMAGVRKSDSGGVPQNLVLNDLAVIMTPL